MPTFNCDFREFKKLAAEFFQSISKSKTVEEIEAGFKCLTIAYLNLNGGESEIHQAQIVIEIAGQKMNQRTNFILFGPPNKP